MFAHIFVYRLRCLLRDRQNIFWTMLFPLVLATLFNLAFSNISSGELFHPIDLAVVDNDSWQKNESFRLTMDEVSTGDDRLFNLTVVSMEEADKLLRENAISGYIIPEVQMKLVVSKSGMYQSIIQSFLDNYIQTASAVETILAKDHSKLQSVLDSLSDRQQYVREVSGSSNIPNTVVNYFYTLIAMACFYGGFFGSREISDIQANISAIAARVNVAPVHKMKAFLSSSCASFLVQFTEMLILLAYLIFILKVDFGSKTGYVLLTTFIGSIAGISFGAFVSALVKKAEGVKIAILIGMSMTCSFLAGMMYQDMKYIIAQKAPILSWLNPLNLLTDAFYCLYYYDTTSRYTRNIIILLGFIAVFCTSTYFIIRRRKYASL